MKDDQEKILVISKTMGDDMRGFLLGFSVFMILMLCSAPSAISYVGSGCPDEQIWGTAYNPDTGDVVGTYSGHWIGYYNPLTYSGIYGVNNARLYSDTGTVAGGI